MENKNKEYKDIVQKYFEQCKESYKAQTAYLQQSTARYHGRVVKTLCIPKLFTEEQVERIRHIAEFTHRILVKTIRQYKKDLAFREKFLFSPEMENLILLDSGIDSELPVARIDIFLNEDTGDFKFCEINTDGTSAMNEDRELNCALAKTFAFQKFKEKYTAGSFELFDSFVEEFVRIYNSYKKKRENFQVAVVDFLDMGTTFEFEQFRQAFERRGIRAEVCEIRNLKYENGSLYSETGMRIDAVYRRAVTCDIMEHLAEIQPFINAVKDCSVCLVGPVGTQIAHSKILFAVLSDPENLQYLTQEEQQFVQRHFPETYLFSSDSKLFSVDEVLRNKDNWILKPVDSYGSKGVFAGVEGNDEQWKRRVNECMDKDYILQKFCKPFETDNVDFSEAHPQFRPYSNLTGLFVYNGKFKGVYSRVSKTEIISTQYSEMALATVRVTDK